MVTQRRRPQANFNPQGPAGLRVQRALSVPFVPPKKQANYTASALGQLGKALGSFGTARLKYEQTRQSDYHAEKKRIDAIDKGTSKASPEERAAFQAKYGIEPSSTRKMMTREELIKSFPKIDSDITEKLRKLEIGGYKTIDEDGNEIEMTADDIQNLFTELETQHTRDIYGDGSGEPGRLRDPQVKMMQTYFRSRKTAAIKRLEKVRFDELLKKGYRSVSTEAGAQLGAGAISGLRGQALWDHLLKESSSQFYTGTGVKVGDPTYKKALVEAALFGIEKDMDTPEEAAAVAFMAKAKLGGSGAQLSVAYPQRWKQITAKAYKILGDEQERVWKAQSITAIARRLGKTGELPQDTVHYTRLDGRAAKLTSNEIETKVQDLILGAANVRPPTGNDPAELLEYRTQVIHHLAGSPIVNKELRTYFDSFEFGADTKPEDIETALQTAAAIKIQDPTKLDKYIRNGETRALLENIERLKEGGLDTASAVTAAHRAINPETGKLHGWAAIGDVYGRTFRGKSIDRDLQKAGIRGEHKEALEAILKVRTASGLIDSDAKDGASKSEFTDAVAEEIKRFKETHVTINGGVIEQPVIDGKEIPAEQYKPVLETHLGMVAKNAGIKPEDVRIMPLPYGKGVRYTDPNGRTLQVTFNGKTYDAAYGHSTLFGQVNSEMLGKAQAENTRKAGPILLRRTDKDMMEEMERAKLKLEKLQAAGGALREQDKATLRHMAPGHFPPDPKDATP